VASPAALANLRPWTDQDRRLAIPAHRSPQTTSARRDLSQYVREQTKNGQEIADFMLAILRGHQVKVGGRNRYATLRHALVAADWLANRAFGLPKEHIELTDETTTRAQRLTLIASMSEEDRATLRALMVRAIAARAEASQTPVESEQTRVAAMTSVGHGQSSDAATQNPEESRELARPVSDNGICVALPVIGADAHDGAPAP